jgi:hypothetical protein
VEKQRSLRLRLKNYDASRHIQTIQVPVYSCSNLVSKKCRTHGFDILSQVLARSWRLCAFDKQLELKLAATTRPSNSNTNLWITWKDPERSTSKSMRSLRSCFSALAEMQVRIFNQLCCGNSYPHQISSD